MNVSNQITQLVKENNGVITLVVCYASIIWDKSPTNCAVHLKEGIFQTTRPGNYEVCVE